MSEQKNRSGIPLTEKEKEEHEKAFVEMNELAEMLSSEDIRKKPRKRAKCQAPN